MEYCSTHLIKGTIHNGSRLTHYVSAEPPKSSTRQPPSNLGQEEYFADLFFQGTPTGSIEIEPAFKANVNFGADWLSFDPDGKHARIDLRGVARYVMLVPKQSIDGVN